MKRWLAALLALCLLCSLAGCGAPTAKEQEDHVPEPWELKVEEGAQLLTESKSFDARECFVQAAEMAPDELLPYLALLQCYEKANSADRQSWMLEDYRRTGGLLLAEKVLEEDEGYQLPELEISRRDQKRMEQQTVVIDDPDTEAMLRRLCRKPEGELTLLDLARVTVVSVGHGEHTDLSFLMYCPNLRALYLEEGHKADLSMVELLPHPERLEVLDLQDTWTEELPDMSRLTGLKVLDLGTCSIDDLTPLAGLTELRTLDLGVNFKIKDLTPLAGLTKLEKLDLARVDMDDLTALSGLTELKVLGLELCDIEDLSPLAGLEKLETLDLSFITSLSDLSQLKALPGLKKLRLGYTELSDLSPLAELTGLEELYLYGNEITDVSPLSGLTGLRVLDLAGSELENSAIRPLSQLTKLEYLELYSAGVSDLSPLADLTELVGLDLGHNQISDLSPLAGLPKLRYLNLRENEISDLSPLAKLTGLQFLLLDDNEIGDIHPLVGLTGLEMLSIAENGLLEVSPLKGHPHYDDYVFEADRPLGDPVYYVFMPSPEEILAAGREAE